MKKVYYLLSLIILFVLFPINSFAKEETCLKINSGEIIYDNNSGILSGQPIQPGKDAYGFNYQAHSFDGYYINSILGIYGLPPYTGDESTYLIENPSITTYGNLWEVRDWELKSKWNDAYQSNKSCDGDAYLDAPFGYVDTGAWVTIHLSGIYPDGGRWSDKFTSIAVTSDAVLDETGSNWYDKDGGLIGPAWGDLAVIKEIINDKSLNLHGIFFRSPTVHH